MHPPTGNTGHTWRPLGRHVKAVGLGDPERLSDPERVRSFLGALVASLGMRPLGDAVVHDVPVELAKLHVEPFEDEGGVTGVVVLSTSHCAIHTWPARRLLVLDVFSCRDFPPGVVKEALDDAFGAHPRRLVDIPLGWWPAEWPAATEEG